MGIVCTVGYLVMLVLFVRAVLSWFPLDPNGVPAQIYRGLYSVTEPILAPIRRVIPPAGGFDLSFLVVVFGLVIILNVLGC